MGQDTKIEWAHHTFSPWRGCSKVSPGCANCYAETQSKRNPNVLGTWGPEGARVVASDAYWRQPLRWDRAAAKAGERRRVFCASLADVFEDRPDLVEPRFRLFALIERTPNLDWLLLTKRPENIERLWPAGSVGMLGAPNIWLGTTAEDQARADERILHILRVQAAVRFLSLEPLLGPVDLPFFNGCRGCNHPGNLLPAWNEHGRCSECDGTRHEPSGIDWAIVGGESGPNARRCDVSWIRSVVAQCREARVPCFVKQLGAFPCHGDDGAGWAADFMTGHGRHWRWDIRESHGGISVYAQTDPKGGDPAEWPEDLRVRQVPGAGRE